MQALPAPVGCREQRHADVLQIRAALAVVGSVHLARQDLAPHILAIFDQFFFRKRVGPAHQLAGDAAFRAALALPVLHRLHLHVLPVLAEGADDAAVAVAVAVGVVPAFPGADRGEVRRLRGRSAPLVARVVRDAVHADPAAAPGLLRRPFDAQVDVAGLARIVVAEIARRAAGAARVDADAGVALGHPLLRVDHFPVLVPVRGAGERVRIVARHDLPGGLVALLEGEPLAVRAVAEDRGVAAFGLRAEYVRAQLEAVVHPDRNVPVDLHALNCEGGTKFPVMRTRFSQSKSKAGSLHRLPTTWTPIGRPAADFVKGRTAAGLPVRLKGQVYEVPARK